MRYYLLVVPFLAACGGPAPTLLRNCNVQIESSWFGLYELNKALTVVTFQAKSTTDSRLQDQENNCAAFDGWTIKVHPTDVWYDRDGDKVAGLTWCDKRLMEIGTPESKKWWDSAFAHESFHVMQGCRSPLPIDSELDEDHSNWLRDGIYPAIDALEVQQATAL